MGTRFIATKECQAHPSFKQAIMEATETSTVTFRVPNSILRCMKNPVAQQALDMQAKGVPMSEIERKVFAGKAKAILLDGDLANGLGTFSPSAGLIEDIPSAEELVKGLVKGYERVKAYL
jgi:NAD(P)H-dependent flavin oxidoreductase YrpB (nitropropane dioxygenase family)